MRILTFQKVHFENSRQIGNSCRVLLWLVIFSLHVCLSRAEASNQGSAAVDYGGLPIRTPWYFDCSHHNEWLEFRTKFIEFRSRFRAGADDPEFVDQFRYILMAANTLGRKTEGLFVKWASSWDIFHFCNSSRHDEISEELKSNFCFYGFVVVQWLGLIGNRYFFDTQGMSDWAHNARNFLCDASKFNAMHFLESSGWPLTMVELAEALSFDHLGTYRPPPDAAIPGLFAFMRSDSAGSGRQAPEHTKRVGTTRLRAVAISYHTSLIREPISFWTRALKHRFDVEPSVHVLDPSARTAEDVERLHSHCKFIEGAWCALDERLLRLNEFFDVVPLDCHKGDHKTSHHFISSTDAYYNMFVELFGRDEEMLKADLFMCGEPVFFCKLLGYFGEPVVGYISTPLSVYVNAADRGQWYQDFYEMAMDSRFFFAATTPIFAEWIVYGTGVSLPVVRPTCLYTDASYWPVREREILLLRTVSLFWDSECILNRFAKEATETLEMVAKQNSVVGVPAPFRFVESTMLRGNDRIGYATFGEFVATVIFPYAFSQFWFYELYAMGVPLYLPSRETLPLHINQDYASCQDFQGHRPGHYPYKSHPFSPFDADDWEGMTYWAGFTDYLLLPHVQHFVSIPQLIFKLQTTNHRILSRKIRQEHTEHVGIATDFWLSVLDQVAAIRRISPSQIERHQAPDTADMASGEIPDELRDLSTRRPSGGSPARADGPHRKANDGMTYQGHPHEFHVDLEKMLADGTGGSAHWWVHLRRRATDPEVKLWPRDCCSETFGHRLWVLIGNTSKLEQAVECGVFEVVSDEQLKMVCHGSGEFIFIESRGVGGWDYQDEGVGVLMLPEVRVLSRE